MILKSNFAFRLKVDLLQLGEQNFGAGLECAQDLGFRFAYSYGFGLGC